MSSLVDLCCRVVAYNYIEFEAFTGIPEHLGKEILRLIIQIRDREFSGYTASRLVEIFSESYGMLFLHRFQISSPEHIETWVPALVKSYSLSALCLDNCELGLMDAAMLRVVGSLFSVKHLSIRYNCLSNDSVRALTAHSRYQKTSNLVVVDLSGNGFISEKSIKLLAAMPSLRMVYLNDTGASVSILQ